jgi:D-inositol-3-phosphate glycosyltransferase
MSRGGSRIAVISMHTSPSARPGGRDAGGMNVYIRASARELAARGATLDLFTRQDGVGPGIEMLDPGVRLIRIDAGPAASVAKQQLPALVPAFTRGVERFARDERARYAIVHSHYWLSGLAGLPLARDWRAPHALMFHTLGAVKNRARLGEDEPPDRIAGERAAALGADRVICATAHEQTLLRQLYGVDRARTTVIPCGVDTELFRPMEQQTARRQLGLPLDQRVLLYAGRIEPLKGLDVAIEALATLEAPRPLLLVVGGDEGAQLEVQRLRAIAAREGVSESVRFVAAAAQAEMPAYYSAADLCVVPSYYESFGMAALEAQACGRPVVASRVGGLPEVVEDGVTGYLVPWRCPEPFAARLELLLHNDGLRQRLGASARERAERFRWQAIAQQLERLYQELHDHAAAGGAELAGDAATDRCHVA